MHSSIISCDILTVLVVHSFWTWERVPTSTNVIVVDVVVVVVVVVVVGVLVVIRFSNP